MRTFLLASVLAIAGTALCAEERPSTHAETLARTLDTIIRADSRGWVFNRYDVGSMSNVRVLQRSDDGHSGIVYGEYTYNGGKSHGWVKVRITKDNLDCLEYWDSPGECRRLGQSASQVVSMGVVAAVLTSMMATSNSGDGNCPPHADTVAADPKPATSDDPIDTNEAAGAHEHPPASASGCPR